MVQNQTEDGMRLRRLLPERAIALAMQSRWSEAADVNRKLIELYPNDADAYNRLGKALLEMGQYGDSLDTYRKAVELDPSNLIAKKNVEKLVHLASNHAPVGEPARIPPRGADNEAARINPNIFIEETGKTGLTNLIKLGPADVLLRLTAGARLELRVSGNIIEVYDEDDEHVGSVEPRVSKRLIGLIEGGNRYSAAVTAAGEHSVTVIIRETYQHPSQLGKFSFPPKALPAGAYRSYVREGALRFGMDDDEENGYDFDSDEGDLEPDEAEEEAEYDEEEPAEDEDEA